jgi:hypothetical protein
MCREDGNMAALRRPNVDNISCFAAGIVLGILSAAIYGIFREAGRLDKMDATWLEHERMRREDDRGRI